jgi:hypothetical protein
MSKHGLKTLTNAKRRRLLAGAEEEAEELTQLREKRAKVGGVALVLACCMWGQREEGGSAG